MTLASGADTSPAIATTRAAMSSKSTISSGVWDSVSSKVAAAENVRVALEYVARGEAPYGIVYATDAKAAPTVQVVGIFPQDSHPAIVYPAALVNTTSPDAKAFLDFLGSAQAHAIFERVGFTTR